MNVVHGISKAFGVEPFWHYIAFYLPNSMTSIYFSVFPGILYHMWYFSGRSKTPYLAYYCLFYLLVFSALAHKEPRFMAPIIPFLFVMSGALLVKLVKSGIFVGTATCLYIMTGVVWTLACLYSITWMSDRSWHAFEMM